MADSNGDDDKILANFLVAEILSVPDQLLSLSLSISDEKLSKKPRIKEESTSKIESGIFCRIFPEFFRYIFKFLSSEDLIACSIVCRFMKFTASALALAVRDVHLIMDQNSRRSKRVGYIEFYDAMSVPMAIALSGQLLFGQPVMVKPSEAEKNLIQSTSTGASGVAGLGADRKIYVGNLHFNISEDQLRQEQI